MGSNRRRSVVREGYTADQACDTGALSRLRGKRKTMSIDNLRASPTVALLPARQVKQETFWILPYWLLTMEVQVLRGQ